MWYSRFLILCWGFETEPSRLIAFNQLLCKYFNITQVDRNIELTHCVLSFSQMWKFFVACEQPPTWCKYSFYAFILFLLLPLQTSLSTCQTAIGLIRFWSGGFPENFVQGVWRYSDQSHSFHIVCQFSFPNINHASYYVYLCSCWLENTKQNLLKNFQNSKMFQVRI